MRGRPYIQWIVFAFFWLLLLYPLIHITTGSDHSSKTEVAVSSAVQTWIHIRFSSQPDRFELLQGDESLWTEEQPLDLEYEKVLSIDYEESSVELVLKASFPDSVTAVEITLTPDGQPERSETIWVEGDVDEMIGLSWEHDHE